MTVDIVDETAELARAIHDPRTASMAVRCDREVRLNLQTTSGRHLADLVVV